MNQPNLVWNIPLQAPPTLLHIAVSRHGREPVECRRLQDAWCLHLYRYAGEMRANGTPLPIRYGFASVMPPGTELEHRYAGRCVDFCAHFTLPDAAGGSVSIPAMQDLGEEFLALSRDGEQAVTAFPINARRAEVRLWEMLWRLAERACGCVSPEPRPHPLVQRAMQRIELRLGEPICVAELAQELEVSHGHLVRLFRAEFDTTIVRYIQARRAQRARHLLLHSTLPIKVIASAVGIDDSQIFNKMIHRCLGVSPRRLREQHRTANL